MLDQSDIERSWPAGLPESLHRPLGDLAALVAKVREIQDKLLPSDMKRDAKSVAKAAYKLLERVRKFENDYFTESHTENYRESALAAIEAGLGHRLGDDERELFRAGMSNLSLQWPLLGLAYHMRAIAAMRSKDGPRIAVTGIYRHAVRDTASLFEWAGLPTDGEGRAMFVDTCKAVLARAGWPATDEKIEHYMRDL